MLTTTQPVPQQRIEPTSGLPPAVSSPAPRRGRLFGRHGVHLVLVGVAALSLGVVIGAATNSSAPHTIRSRAVTASRPAAPAAHHPAAVANQPAAQHQTGASKRPAAAPAPAMTKPNDKGWAVESLNVKRDFIGAFTGTARISNTNDSSRTAAFTFTLFRGGRQVGVLEGTADDVSSGKTVTVDLVSEDTFSAGAFSYDFQANLSF